MKPVANEPVLVGDDATLPEAAVLFATLIHRMAETGKSCWVLRTFVTAWEKIP